MNGNELWSDEQVAQLRELWESMLYSAAGIASIMKLTRNSVMGKAHRMGLTKRVKTGFVRPKRNKKPKPLKRARNKIENYEFTPLNKQPDYVELVYTIADSLNIPLEQKGDHQCSWPMGDATPYLFCGLNVDGQVPYCRYHCSVAYTPAAERRRHVRTYSYRL